MEADPRHAENLIAYYNLDGARATKVPGVKVTKKEEGEDGPAEDPDDEELLPKEATEHRGIAARLNYLVADRADIQFAAKELESVSVTTNLYGLSPAMILASTSK